MVQFLTGSDLKTMLVDPNFRRYLGVMSLCMASISTLLALGFVGISFATDNWKHISVNRGNLKRILLTNESSTNVTFDFDEQDFKTNLRYFDRVEGLFRICFPMAEKPQRNNDHDIYLSPILSEWCTNIEYYVHLIMEDGLVPDKMTTNGKVWIHIARSVIASFCLYFATMAVACFIGLIGCYQMSDNKLIWTGSLMMIAFFVGAAGMGMFHCADFYEKNKVFDERLEFYQTWPEILQQNTKYNYGWSYIIAWLGLMLTLLASALLAVAAAAMRSAEHLLDDDLARQTIVDQTNLVMDQFDADVREETLRRYGSQALLSSMPPGTGGPIYGPGLYPPGYSSYPQNSYIDEVAFRKEIKQFSDAQL